MTAPGQNRTARGFRTVQGSMRLPPNRNDGSHMRHALRLPPLAAASLLVFCLLYTPCVAAIASVKRELGAKWAVGVVLGQCLIAWGAAGVVRLVGVVLGLG